MEQNNENNALEVTTPNEQYISVKFNKEMKNIPLSEATALLQKGMKFDLISEDFKAVKELAQQEKMSLSEYVAYLSQQKEKSRFEGLLEECKGDEELARRLLAAEGGGTQEDASLQELREYFPKIKNLEDLPQEVAEQIRLKGENPLNTYLRYLLKEKIKREKAKKERADAEFSGIGPQGKNVALDFDAAADRFLKGIWGR